MLELDIGNTRVKCRQASEPTNIMVIDDTAKMPVSERARFGSVRSEQRTRELLAPLIMSGVECLRATVASVPALQCDYEQPERLGVDRWLAALGACEIYHEAIVVDAGTALTVDYIAEGVFYGGIIAQGVGLSVTNLLAGTDRVGTVSFESLPKVPANTASAVGLGAVAQAVGLIKWLQERWAPNAPLVVTGGDGPLLVPYLGEQVHYQEGLVLNGLKHAKFEEFK
ncbi:type III pantothenate kinase [uncultured Umboniibacter sp.]|uniref:type III pantothenate kinase n=1 Tax=uncultured Umboniibacter sp. TaxID=1798917 RepID=UPI00261906C2|nr:type III pantothenate kinase [uncultured Umboniibacter sp.]